LDFLEIFSRSIFYCCGSGSGIRYLFDPWIRNGKKSGSGMNNPDIFPRAKKQFWVKILEFFDAHPGSGLEKIRIQDAGWKKFVFRIRNITIFKIGQR
jgi:hypothetical protein